MQFLSQKSNAESIDFAAYHVLWVLEHARLELNRYDKWSLCIWQRNEPIQDAAIATRFVYWHPPILTSRTTGAYRSQISMPRVPDGTNVAGITRTPFPEPGSNKPPKCIFWNLFELSGALVQRPPAAPLRLPIQGTWKHLTIVLVPYTYRTVCRYFQRLKRVFASLFVRLVGRVHPGWACSWPTHWPSNPATGCRFSFHIRKMISVSRLIRPVQPGWAHPAGTSESPLSFSCLYDSTGQRGNLLAICMGICRHMWSGCTNCDECMYEFC